MKYFNKITLPATLTTLSFQTVDAENTIKGHWEGQMIQDRAVMAVSVDIRGTGKK